MKAVGIIAEYNPFHKGHQYHIEKAKELAGADYAIVIMSGNFVQRGAPSVTDKYTRAGMALMSGADLVFELPVRYACASAERFSMGAVASLHNLALVDCLCFGSECGDLSLLDSLACVLAEEPDAYRLSLKALLRQGASFPSARKTALLAYLGEAEDSPAGRCLRAPNNILGIEYLKALRRLRSPIIPLTIPREGRGYHDTSLSPAASAAAIRHFYQENQTLAPLADFIPKDAFELLKKMERKTFPLTEQDLSPFLFYKLLEESGRDLSIYQDVSPDLARRIQNASPSFLGFGEFASCLKSRQYTRTRINRALLHIVLDLRNDLQAAESAPYLRLLGLKKEASHLLRGTSFCPLVPVITKAADADGMLTEDGRLRFREDIHASRLYQYIIYRKFGHEIPDDYRTSPLIL